MRPRPPKLQLKWAQDMALATKMVPNTPEVAPGRLQGPILADFGPHFHRFLIDFCIDFDLHFGSYFIDFERILEPILLHFNIDVAAHTPLCRMSHRSPKARGGGDSPQAPSIDR